MSLFEFCLRAICRLPAHQLRIALDNGNIPSELQEAILLTIEPNKIPLLPTSWPVSKHLLRARGFCSYQHLLVASGYSILNSRLALTASRDDLLEVKRLVREGAIDYYSAAVQAASHGVYRTTEWLLGKLASWSGMLLPAVSGGNQQLIDLILERGVDSQELHQALIVAARRGCAPAVLQLLAVDANIDDRMLVAALASGNSEVIAILLSYYQGYRPAIIETLLLRHRSKLARDAAANNNLTMVNSLLTFPGNVPIDALVGAAANGHLEMVKLLLPRVDGVSKALNIAVVNGHTSIVKWILASNPTARISEAPARYDSELIELVKQFSKRTISLKSPACSGDLDVIKELFGLAAHSAIWTVAGLAICYGHLEVLEWCVGMDSQTAIPAFHQEKVREAARLGHLEMVARMTTSNIANELLAIASAHGQLALAKQLISNFQFIDKGTALLSAVEGGHPLIAQLLVDDLPVGEALRVAAPLHDIPLLAPLAETVVELANDLLNAASNGRKQDVERLIYLQLGNEEEARQAAVSAGHQDIAVLLTRSDGQPNYWLIKAVRSGQTSSLPRLLTRVKQPPLLAIALAVKQGEMLSVLAPRY